MTEETNIIDQLRDRGVTCGKLKAIEKRQRKDAESFRKLGFLNIANIEEETANKVREVKNKVCLLK